ncbi:hypothetical protein [uncultured Anaerovibrio sp.]|uniref:hypothetical protein n=1 Tax=uncultured Anaerovibrio sp. TaxID=361586 RepID=UPI002611296B|nr:hypothetical protein [uncultured Anaerovibrio sp.]
MYLCKFDEAGRRIATVLKGVHFKTKAEKQKYLDQGYIETSDDDYAFYVGNKGTGANGTGYVRGDDGKPTDAPVKVPSIEEKKQVLITQYEADKDTLVKYYADAALHDDTDLMAELKEEMAELDEKFAEDMEELED